ncbi:SDR family NAD(P)-dependent oxidoreductase, partial [Daejeonella sp.]|uniref:SDR family NAD(P)-dependent oxidoreductase n=1 Tax=Daejeonella sp. TaxID=2805397 RepID=UPI0030C0F2AD
MNRLKGRLIIVTGGNGLLGGSIVNQIADEGGICINVDINHETSADLTQYKCDITNSSSIDKCIEDIIQCYGRIDGLVNNAYPRTADWGNKFEDIPFSSWQKNVDGQLNSYFYFTQ